MRIGAGRRRLQRTAFAGLLVAGLACTTASAPAPTPAPNAIPRPPSELATTLSGLAEDALAEGDLVAAEQRYRRLLGLDPTSATALAGLGRVALARAEPEAARARFEAAVAADPDAAAGWIGLADTETDPVAARAHLERAIERNRGASALHARLAALTGRAPREAATLDEAITLAMAHPYDPSALARAGALLARADRVDEALPVLETVLTLADLDPASAERAVSTLRGVDPAWSTRRVVPVHVFVDDRLRADPGWRFQQRALWLDLSLALGPVLDTRFVVVRFAAFDPGRVGDALEPMLGLVAAQPAPRDAIVAGFTAIPEPPRRGAKRGLADYLGRHLVVRDLPGGEAGRITAHELMHIYGGVHVVDQVESLMNAGSKSRTLDALNARIARAFASRAFGGGFERDVLPHVDRGEAIDALVAALETNLVYRRLGLNQLFSDPYASRYYAAREASRLQTLDPHIADVSRFLSRLLWEEDRRVEAVVLLETAAQLYGPATPRGRQTAANAERLRQHLRAELGVP